MSTCDALRRAAVATGIALLLLVPIRAGAQPSAQDQATARALFNEARQLMKDGRYPDACAKLESASKLYEGSGLLLNLGDCYEHLGRTASAWTEFGQAVTAAERAGRADDLAEARRRQAAVEPKLSRLAVRVPHATTDFVVKRDGSVLDRGAWGEAVPVDPGTHEVSAEATGHVGWSGSASVTGAGKTVSIEVPELAPAPEPAAPAPAPPAPSADAAPPYWSGRRIASASLAAVGVVGLGAGVGLALVAKSQDNTARTEATNRNADSTSAVNLGNIATVVTSVGGAVAAAGLLLWLTAPDAPVHVGASPSAVFVAGSF